MMSTITNIVATSIFIWSLITLLFNFVVPHSFFFQYEELYAADVCRYAAQEIKGSRWSRFSNPSAGVDEIFPVGINIPADRFSWPDGFYDAGLSTSGWTEIINVRPREYYWKNTQLRLDVFYVFPVYLDESERPVSNVFTVSDCTQQIDLSDEVAQAFETYLEVEGYVVD